MMKHPVPFMRWRHRDGTILASHCFLISSLFSIAIRYMQILWELNQSLSKLQRLDTVFRGDQLQYISTSVF